MYAAITMGAKVINIIGCGFQAIGGKEHFGKQHGIDASMRPETGSFTGSRGERMQIGLDSIIKGCVRNGIRVNRFNDYEQARNHNKKF